MKKAMPLEAPEKISISEMLLFCIHSITSKGDSCDFERLTKECFVFFPHTFGFSKYPLWPDSRKLDRPLRALKQERFIEESASQFKLTKAGQKLAEDIAKTFRQKKLFT